MNNNMPNNNFNNGLPNGAAAPVNEMPNPVAEEAKQQLVGGQSAVGSGPSVMQGVPNAPQENNVMQGVADIPNIPNVMQGAPAPEPAPTPVMPGQGNSGINAYTMQTEEPKAEEPGVVSIPSFAPNIPEPAPAPEPAPMPNMEMNNEPPVNPVMPNVQMPNVPNEPVVSQNPLNPMNNMNSIGSNPVEAPNVNIISEPVMPNVPEQPMNNGPLMNDIPAQPNNIVSPVMNNKIPEPAPAPMPNAVNSQIGDLNDTVAPSASQVGQADLAAMDNDLAEMPDVPAKKFPLSVREMVLIGIALVGIIIVVVVYWPK